MIHILVPIFISSLAIFCVEKQSLKTLFSLSNLFFAVLTILFISRYDNIVNKIPFTRIDDSEYTIIDENGVMFLESGYSSMLSNEYLITGEFDEDSVEKWVETTNRAIKVGIMNKDSVIWFHSIGVANDNSVSRIREIYETWVESKKVPKDSIRYQFLCFYIDI